MIGVCMAEQVAETSAYIVNIADEFCKRHVVGKAEVTTHFLDKLLVDNRLQLQCLGVVREKDPNFCMLDIVPLKALAESRSSTMPLKKTETIASLQGNLEQETFLLVMKQLKYDVEAFKVYKRRVLEVEHARFYADLEKKQKEHENATAAAEAFLDRWTLFLHGTDPQRIVRDITDFMRKMAVKRRQGDDNNMVAAFHFCLCFAHTCTHALRIVIIQDCLL